MKKENFTTSDFIKIALLFLMLPIIGCKPDVENNKVDKIEPSINNQVTDLSETSSDSSDPFDLTPQILIISPDTFETSNFEDRYLNVEALLENVLEKEEMEIFLNEESHEFEFDPESSLLTANLKLSKGDNIIKIFAENSEGSKTEIINVYRAYEKGQEGENGDNREFEELQVIEQMPRRKPTVDITQTPKQGAKATIKFRVSGITNTNDATVLVNGTKSTNRIKKIDKTSWSIQINLVKEINKIEVIVKNQKGSASDKATVSCAVCSGGTTEKGSLSKESTSKNSSGKIYSYQKTRCATFNKTDYTFDITAHKNVELLEMAVVTNNCGGIEISVKSKEGSKKMTTALTKGYNQLVMNDLKLQFKKGTRYTITCKTIAGYGNCPLDVKPQLEDAKGCNLSAKNASQFNVDYKGKSIIYDLKYL